MLKSSLCDYSDVYIFVKRTITVAAEDADAKKLKVIFKNCAPFTDFVSKINNTQVDYAKDIDDASVQLNTVITIQKHQQVHFNITETKEL